ncbi:MAG TPA: GTPase Era [Polyangiaceae bacterium]|nr:GTPase Era [Polyangiaceae bacterium]
MRFGTITIVGRSNVGKSTFLNAALGEHLAIVSRLPQTTRDVLLGVVHRPGAQLAFYDTPGLHHARSELGRRMNASALEAARSADVLLLLSDVSTMPKQAGKVARVDPSALVGAEDARLIAELPADVPALLVVNKVDLLRSKTHLLPLIESFRKLRQFASVVPACLLEREDVERVLQALCELVTDGPPAFADDMLTDRPQSFFAREFVREAVLGTLRGEVPHAIAVSIDRYEELEKLVRIAATVHVEKLGQRKIVVGEGGQIIREIGTLARKRIEGLVGRKVYLELFVRVTPRWKNMPRQLSELGYEGSASGPAETASSGTKRVKGQRA